MILRYPVLRQRIRENEVSWAELASVVGVTPLSFHMKMWGLKRWTLTDAVRICGFFRTPDVEHLFVRNYHNR